jgi:hypothetical protein
VFELQTKYSKLVADVNKLEGVKEKRTSDDAKFHVSVRVSELQKSNNIVKKEKYVLAEKL